MIRLCNKRRLVATSYTYKNRLGSDAINKKTFMKCHLLIVLGEGLIKGFYKVNGFINSVLGPKKLASKNSKCH